MCRVKLNYVVISNINDSQTDLDKMIKYLSPFKKDIIVKISYLNFTQKCKENNLKSPASDRMLEILRKLKEEGFDCYLFGTDNNTQLGCGQLVQNYISKDQTIKK